MDAPDIIKVVLKRNGEIIQPNWSTLEPHVFTNKMGASTTLHAGDVEFPCSAFSPDGTVTITAIPESGINIVKVLGPNDLKPFK